MCINPLTHLYNFLFENKAKLKVIATVKIFLLSIKKEFLLTYFKQNIVSIFAMF